MFQRIANWIKSWKTPDWMERLLEEIWIDILVPAIHGVGKEVIQNLQNLILEASKKDMSGEMKFRWVFNEFKERWGGVELKDSLINLLIQLLVVYLKAKKFI